MNKLDEICAVKRIEVERRKAAVRLADLERRAAAAS